MRFKLTYEYDGYGGINSFNTTLHAVMPDKVTIYPIAHYTTYVPEELIGKEVDDYIKNQVQRHLKIAVEQLKVSEANGEA